MLCVNSSSRIFLAGVVVCLSVGMLLLHSQSLSDHWSAGIQTQIGLKDESKTRLRNLLTTLELEDSTEKLFINGLNSFSKIQTATDDDARKAGIKMVQWRYLKRKVLELSAVATKPEVVETDSPVVKISPLSGVKQFILQPLPRENYTLATRSPPTVKKPIPSERVIKTLPPQPTPTPSEQPVKVKSKIIPGSAAETQVQKLIETEIQDKPMVAEKETPAPPRKATPSLLSTDPPTSLKDNTLVLLELPNGHDSFTCTLDKELYPDTVPTKQSNIKLVRVQSKQQAIDLDSNFTLFVQEPIAGFAGMLKRNKPDCLGLADPKRNPLDIYSELGDSRSTCEIIHNRLTKTLAGAPMEEPATKETLTAALQFLASISTIFVGDRLDASMHMLSQKSSGALQNYAVCQHHVQFTKRKLDSAVLSAIEEQNKVC